MIFVPGGGSGRFSMLFVTDLTRAIHAWIRSGEGNAACFEIHDGTPDGYSWEEVRQIAANLYRRPVRRIDIPRRALHAAARLNAAAARVTGYRPMLTPGKVRELCHTDWTCSNGRFSNATGWRPEVELREGLLRTLA
jgi:nucleoside-diphosphate-sugar epimerase